jgi:hypothetical protein
MSSLPQVLNIVTAPFAEIAVQRPTSEADVMRTTVPSPGCTPVMEIEEPEQVSCSEDDSLPSRIIDNLHCLLGAALIVAARGALW